MSEKDPETEDQFKERKRQAERAHDSYQKAEEVHSRQIEVFSIAAMRAPALAAAGGIAAGIGFFSANYGTLKHLTGGIDLFNHVIFWFFLALVFAVFTPGAAYFSQLAYQDSVQNMDRKWHHPYVVTTKRASKAKNVGDFFRWLAVFLNLCAIVSVIIGGLKFLSLVGLM